MNTSEIQVIGRSGTKVYECRRYMAVVDLCLIVPRLAQAAETLIARRDLRKVCQRRRIEGTNKDFDLTNIAETIVGTFAAFTRSAKRDWLVMQNSSHSREVTADPILNRSGQKSWRGGRSSRDFS